MKDHLLSLARITNLVISTALLGAFVLCPALAHEAAGGDVRVVSTIDSGGSVQSGGNVQITGFVGEPGIVAAGGDVIARQGGNSIVYYATGFTVSPEAATINERGSADSNSTRTQLQGNVVYDDATLGAVDGSLVSWAAPSPGSALASISAGGIAQAATVYQNTVASFSGAYGGITATSSLTVLNILPDNYGVYAGDTFDDAWEIAQGMSGAVNPNAMNNGVPNWQLYAMGFNPAQPAPAVLASTATTGGYFAVRYTRNPYATNYTFNPQETGNLSVGFTNMVSPVSVTNLVSGVEQITTRGSVPINATNKQFLRVKVAQPAP
jgi:hypothetical protein